jgi:hypothetical protein
MICCTEKLRREMGFRGGDPKSESAGESGLGPWHANLIHIDRRKCVLFANDATLFNFIVPGVGRAEIRELGELFRTWLQTVVAEEGLSQPTRERLQNEYVDVGYGPSRSRSVLGSMNDLAFHYRYGISEAGGVDSAQVPEIIKQLNRMPMGAIDYVYPIEAFRAVVGE